jgi:hypothetical protein
MMTGETDLILSVADYINKLPDNHRVHRAFGAKLRYYYEESRSNPDNTVFLYNFPLSDETPPNSEAAYALGIGQDIISSNTPAVAIVPEGGVGPIQAMKAWNPYFSILCRHSLPGCAYRCLYYLMLELNQNARVFRQNGLILAVTSQPATVWNDRRGLTVYKAAFRVLAAEPIV